LLLKLVASYVIKTSNFDTPFFSYYILMVFCFQQPLSWYLVHSKVSNFVVFLIFQLVILILFAQWMINRHGCYHFLTFLQVLSFHNFYLLFHWNYLKWNYNEYLSFIVNHFAQNFQTKYVGYNKMGNLNKFNMRVWGANIANESSSSRIRSYKHN